MYKKTSALTVELKKISVYVYISTFDPSPKPRLVETDEKSVSHVEFFAHINTEHRSTFEKRRKKIVRER